MAGNQQREKIKSLNGIVRLITVVILSAPSAVLLGASAASFLTSPPYIADQMSHFRLAYIILSVPLLLLSALCRSRIASALYLSVLLLNAAFCIPFYLRSKTVPATTAGESVEFKLLAINLHGWENPHHDGAIRYVQEVHPDVLCLSEMTQKWLADFDKALPDYKYKFDEGVSGGAAIYSRIPVEQTFPSEGRKIRRYGTRGFLHLNGRKILIISEHTPAPFTFKRWEERNQEYLRLASETKNASEPMIIIGDLNSSPWSWYFQNLLKNGQLIDSETGHGLQPSWNALSRIPPFVPIDHCLTTPGIEIASRTLGPKVGSDHLPLLIKVRLPSTP